MLAPLHVVAYPHRVPWITGLFLLVVFVALPWQSGRTFRSGLLTRLPRTSIYLSAVFSQWLLALGLGAVVWWERRSGLHGPLTGPIAVWPLIGWAVATLAAGMLLVGATWLVRRRLGQAESAELRHLLPVTRRERLLFCLVVSPTAGIVEELVFRGYAISRLAPFTGGAWSAALCAAVAFAAGHQHQGILGMSRAGAIGLVLTVPYVATGSLLPSIVAHALIDLICGLFPQLLSDAPEAVDGLESTSGA